MGLHWVAGAVFVLTLAAISCGGGTKPAEPDRVVGVLLKCTVPPQTQREYRDGNRGSYVVPAHEFSGDMCEQILGRAPDRQEAVGYLNVRYVVTVRTDAGSSYTVEVAATTRVKIGQVWPPTN